MDSAKGLLDSARAHYDKQAFSLALAEQWKVLHDANSYFAEMAPWVLRKEDPQRMSVVLAVTLDVVRRVALLAQPVMPDSMTRMLDVLGVRQGAMRTFAAFDSTVEAGTPLPKPQPIFPRYEEPQSS